MRKFRIRYLAIAVPSLWLAACSGGGSCDSCSSNGTPGTVSLKIVSPPEYPAGLGESVQLTVTNTSANTLTNLKYTVPPAGSPGNNTGVAIDASNGDTACPRLVPAESCEFTATIESNSNPGTFTVTATGIAANARIKSADNSVGVSEVPPISTTNIGLASIPSSSTSPLYLLPNNQTLIPNNGTSTPVYFSLAIESAGNVGVINIYNGQTIVDTLTGPFTPGQVLTVRFLLPPGVNSTQSITAVPDNCSSNCSNNASINIATAGSGIVIISPSSVEMSGLYESQVYTLTNTGQSVVSLITMPNVESQFIVSESADCSGTLAIGDSCSFRISYTPAFNESGVESLNITYFNSKQTESALSSIYYNANGLTPGLGNLSLSSGFAYDCDIGATESVYAVINNANGYNGQQVVVTGSLTDSSSQSIVVNNQAKANKLARLQKLVNKKSNDFITPSCTITIANNQGSCLLFPASFKSSNGCSGGDIIIESVVSALPSSPSFLPFPFESATAASKGALYFNAPSDYNCNPGIYTPSSVVAIESAIFGYESVTITITENVPAAIFESSFTCNNVPVVGQSATCEWTPPSLIDAASFGQASCSTIANGYSTGGSITKKGTTPTVRFSAKASVNGLTSTASTIGSLYYITASG